MTVEELAIKTNSSKIFIEKILSGDANGNIISIINFLNKIGYKTTLIFDKK